MGFGVHAPQIPYLSLEKTLAVAACLVFAYINFRGASETGKAGNFVTMAKILIILFFVAAGAWAMRGMPEWQGNFHPFLFGAFLIVLGALGLAFGLGGQEKAREIIRRISKVEEGDPPAIAKKNRGAGDAEKGEP